jgi:hypothetical protein
VNGIFLLASRRTRTSDTRSERQIDVWTICKLCLVQCDPGLLRRQACFWQSSDSVCQSPTLRSLSALEMLISTGSHYIPKTNIAELSMPLSNKIGPALSSSTGVKTVNHLLGKRLPVCSATVFDTSRIRLRTLLPP